MNGLLRMADANANRAAEALRTLEDAARFVLGDSVLSRRFKTLRHDLHAALEGVESLRLAAARDAAGDPAGAGTSVPSRRGAVEVVAAGVSRLGESLRALEEALRVLRPEAAERVERIRYLGYDACAALTLACASGGARQWALCLVLTESLCMRPWREVLLAALRSGADCVQLREKAMADGALLDRAREVVSMARPFGASVIVNDRIDIALAAGADGVHLGREDLPIREARLYGGSLIIGASTHDPDEAAAAVAEGADYCGVGAMFATSLKPDRAPSGAAFMRWFADHHPGTPHLAIGGITPERLEGLIAAGCRGVAVSRAICEARDPGEVTARFCAALGRTARDTAAPALGSPR